jgi:hypothetical protein
MSHEQFLLFVRSILGKLPHMEARESLANLMRTKGHSFSFQDHWIPKGTLGGNPKNPLLQVDGIQLELGFCNSDKFTIYVPEESRK